MAMAMATNDGTMMTRGLDGRLGGNSAKEPRAQLSRLYSGGQRRSGITVHNYSAITIGASSATRNELDSMNDGVT